MKQQNELNEKGIVTKVIPENELPKDVHGNKVDLDTYTSSSAREFLKKQICDLINVPNFNLDEKDYNTFLQLVNGMSFEAGTSEMALAFITVSVMDKDKLIIERNNREEDFKTLINIIVYLYRHASEPKSTLLLLAEALELYIPDPESNFRSAILVGKTYFEDVVDLVRKPIQPQPQFYS